MALSRNVDRIPLSKEEVSFVRSAASPRNFAGGTRRTERRCCVTHPRQSGGFLHLCVSVLDLIDLEKKSIGDMYERIENVGQRKYGVRQLRKETQNRDDDSNNE